MNGYECPTCELVFSTDNMFIKHRVGEYGTPERRCLTQAELEAAGWRFTDRGWTKAKPMPKGIYTKPGEDQK